jgi:hypothetical protein
MSSAATCVLLQMRQNWYILGRKRRTLGQRGESFLRSWSSLFCTFAINQQDDGHLDNQRNQGHLLISSSTDISFSESIIPVVKFIGT